MAAGEADKDFYGDSDNDITAAREAGARGIRVLRAANSSYKPLPMAGALGEEVIVNSDTDDRLNAINGSDGAAVFLCKNQGWKFYLFTYCCTLRRIHSQKESMMWYQQTLTLGPKSRGFHLVTDEILGQIAGCPG
ncbi:acid phosphatase/phosphotransferase [Klebsiella pneumoniae]|uniref:Acid phosphatase/phosphotransferase n=1 Tax=Klebsiella pneumoniae TaxID=573 RepID=A0A377ZQF0_KLEPN|nr:acid phosphatase/phosphotransferase [Klebsiella pneumoniae]